MGDLPQAIKDPEAARPFAAAWRPVFADLVHALVEGDFALSCIPGVRPVAPGTSNQMRDYLKSYGATLVDLPDATWTTSVAQWVNTHWEVLLDLWTAEGGRSDLVLHARVFEAGESFEVEIEGIWVP